MADIKTETVLSERTGSGLLYIDMAVKRGIQAMAQFHYHASYELFYVKSGSVDFIIGNTNYTLTDGNLLVIPPYVAHRSLYKSTAFTQRYEICVNEECLEDSMKQIMTKLSQNICYAISLKYQEPIVKLLDKMCEEKVSEKEYAEELNIAYTHAFLITLYRNALGNPVSGHKESNLSQKIMEYISGHYAEDIKMSEVAAACNICESYLYKVFKQHTGLKMNDYLNFTRIMHAERLMRESDLPLMEIADQCGFHDSNYFSTVFKKYKNMPPGKFMRGCRKN